MKSLRLLQTVLLSFTLLGIAQPVRALLPGPQKLAIYYGYPSLVNGAAGNLAAATAHFAAFDVVVLGDGLQQPAHPDHANTAQIVTDLIASGTEVYGYVDMGVSTQNLPLATAQQYVDAWDALGVTGIFWDDAGYDYGVDRGRQAAFIGYTHGVGLKAFVNAWDPDDIFAFDGVATPLQAGDWYLAESSPVADGDFADLAAWWAKSQQLAGYRDATNVNIAAIATGADGPLGWANAGAYRQSLWAAYLFAWDAFGFTNIQYSSSGPGANRLRPLPRVATNVGNTYTGNPTQVNPTTFSRTTDTGTIVVTGDTNEGYGTFRGGACDTSSMGDAIWPNCSGTPPPQSSPFGPRQKASESFRYDFHRGVDIPQPLGDPVYAMQDGIVRLAGSDPGYSDGVIQLRHRGSTPYLFSNVLHMDSVVVQVDDLVTVGDLVGYSGESVGGFDHMHMEFRDGCANQNCNVNPWGYLPYTDTAPVAPSLSAANLGVAQAAVVVDVSVAPGELDFDGLDIDWDGTLSAGIDALNATTDPGQPTGMDHPVYDLGGGTSLCIFPAPFNTASSSADYRFAFFGLPPAASGTANGRDVQSLGSAVALTPNLPDVHVAPTAAQSVVGPGAIATFQWTVSNQGGAPANLSFTAQSAQSSPLQVTPDQVLLAAGEDVVVMVEVDLRDELAAGIGDCILFEVDAGGPYKVVAGGRAVTGGTPHGCPDAPAGGCVAATAASLAIADDPSKPEKKKLQWKFAKPAVSIDPADFGDPVNGAGGFRLCLYDAQGGVEALAGGAAVAAGGSCGGKACWKPGRDGFKFKDRGLAQGGVASLSVRGGEAKRSKLSFKAKGVGLDLRGAAGMSYLHADTTVRVQLVETATDACWESVFEAPAQITKNTATQAKAKRKP